jgi:hypothetical protein
MWLRFGGRPRAATLMRVSAQGPALAPAPPFFGSEVIAMKFLAPLLCAALVGPAALAQQAPPQPVASTVTLRPTQTTLQEVVRAMTEQTGARILIGSETTGQPALSLSAVPLETALSVVAKATGNKWSRLVVPADKAESLTAPQAETLVSSADALAAGAVSVRTSDGKEVAVVTRPPAPDHTAVVYLIQTTKDVAAIRAAREAAEKKAKEDARAADTDLSPDAKSDPAVVNAYSQLRSLTPDQIAVVAREFMTRMTPDEQQALNRSFENERQRMQGSQDQAQQ